MNINIALCTDEKFFIPALVCVTSILENNKENSCNIYILTEGLSKKSLERINKTSELYNQRIIVKIIDIEKFNSLVTRNRYPLSIYFRLLLPEIISDVDNILYLDCDIIVRHSLNDLFSIKIDEYACGVVIDQQCDDVVIQNRLRIFSEYFNSGVLLINLKYWKKYHISEKIIKYIQNNPQKCIYPDQDALNKILENKVFYLDCKYNCQELWLTTRDEVRFHFSRWENLDRSLSDPVIIHFCTGDKPWFKECKNPYKEEFLTYASKNKYIEFKLRKKYSIFYYFANAWKMRFHRLSLYFIKK